jgi:predicted regulator of Ras-like GTPase activity (Roadblock/LC7/MglB family)
MFEHSRSQGENGLVDTLDQMNAEAGFPLSVLTNAQGLLIASSASEEGQDPNKQSAIVAKVREAAQLVRSQLDMGVTDEISVYDEDGRRLVCRPLSINGHDLILAVVVPTRGQAYRRATNTAISGIRRAWAFS